MSLLPIFADQVLHVGPAGYGWLVAAPALGRRSLGSLYTSLRPLPRAAGRVLLLGSVAAYGVATVVYGLSRSYWLDASSRSPCTGLADLVSTVIRQTLRQLLTPDALRGRMTSVNMIFFMGGPQLGEMEAGLVASLFASAARRGHGLGRLGRPRDPAPAPRWSPRATPVVRDYEPPTAPPAALAHTRRPPWHTRAREARTPARSSSTGRWRASG